MSPIFLKSPLYFSCFASFTNTICFWKKKIFLFVLTSLQTLHFTGFRTFPCWLCVLIFSDSATKLKHIFLIHSILKVEWRGGAYSQKFFSLQFITYTWTVCLEKNKFDFQKNVLRGISWWFFINEIVSCKVDNFSLWEKKVEKNIHFIFLGNVFELNLFPQYLKLNK